MEAFNTTPPKANKHRLFQAAYALVRACRAEAGDLEQFDENTLCPQVDAYSKRHGFDVQEFGIAFLLAWAESGGGFSNPLYEANARRLTDSWRVDVECPYPDAVAVGTICAHMQVIAGDDDIWISGEALGDLLGISRMHIWRILRLLEIAGIVQQTERGRRGQCTRYRALVVPHVTECLSKRDRDLPPQPHAGAHETEPTSPETEALEAQAAFEAEAPFSDSGCGKPLLREEEPQPQTTALEEFSAEWEAAEREKISNESKAAATPSPKDCEGSQAPENERKGVTGALESLGATVKTARSEERPMAANVNAALAGISLRSDCQWCGLEPVAGVTCAACADRQKHTTGGQFSDSRLPTGMGSSSTTSGTRQPKLESEIDAIRSRGGSEMETYGAIARAFGQDGQWQREMIADTVMDFGKEAMWKGVCELLIDPDANTSRRFKWLKTRARGHVQKAAA